MKKPERIKILLIYGGSSAEHDVSVLSARNIYKSLNEKKYQTTLIKISKEGKWFLVNENILYSSENGNSKGQKNNGVEVSIDFNNKAVRVTDESAKIIEFDVVFPVLHGPYGEDGSIQGLLRLLGIPFVGSGVLGSAIGMDKDIMKKLLRDAGLPIGNFSVLYKNDTRDQKNTFSTLKKKLGLPLFIKPANLGSSVGISVVNNEDEFEAATKKAFAYDKKIIVEEFIEGREIECSVLGNETPVSSLPGEICTDKMAHKFYSYEAKYLNEKGVSLIAPAKISEDKIKHIQDMAVKVFKVLNCEGLGRVDFFLCDDGSLYVNEINTMPGFTSVSMYPKLWEVSGVSNEELVDRLIGLAIEKK